jgi:hypothetical protein
MVKKVAIARLERGDFDLVAVRRAAARFAMG